MKKIILSILLLGIAFSIFSCKRTECKSFKRNWEINIDGDDTDWPDSCIHYLENPGQAVCFADDKSHFYLLLRLSDPRTIMQVVSQGATIWFEPNGQNRLGIHYPIGLSKNIKKSESMSDQPYGEQPHDFRRRLYKNREAPVDTTLLKQAQNEMEVLVPEKALKQLIMSVISKSYGIEAKFAYKGERFIYELKMPLNKIPEYDFALDIGAKNEINIDIESEAPDMKSGPTGGAGSSDFGGMTEGGPLGGGVPDGIPSGGRGTPPAAVGKTEKIEMKFLVKLLP